MLVQCFQIVSLNLCRTQDKQHKTPIVAYYWFTKASTLANCIDGVHDPTVVIMKVP